MLLHAFSFSFLAHIAASDTAPSLNPRPSPGRYVIIQDHFVIVSKVAFRDFRWCARRFVHLVAACDA